MAERNEMDSNLAYMYKMVKKALADWYIQTFAMSTLESEKWFHDTAHIYNRHRLYSQMLYRWASLHFLNLLMLC
jgi:hypothetical protein